MALAKIGESPITSLDDKSKKARDLRALFDLKRDDLLRKHPWRFAIKRVNLVQDSEDPISQFSNQFLLPSDLIKIVGVTCTNDRYAREGNKILTDDSTVELLYIFRNEDVNSWDPSFVTVMAHFLAYDLAWSIKGSRTLRADLKNEFERELALARHSSAQEGAPPYYYSDEGEGELIAVRLQTGRGRLDTY